MPLQKLEEGDLTYFGELSTGLIVYEINKVIDYCNELERRLAEVEKPVERIKSETRSTGEYEPQTLQEDAEEDERLAKCCKSKIIKS